MNSVRRLVVFVLPSAVLIASGCAAPKIDFAGIERPSRAAELDAYNVFVGSWTWEAQMLNAEGAAKNWTGTAKWSWTLDDRTLQGTMSARSEAASFESAGIWSWHPKSKKYIWWMFNNWGYPQQGTAHYDSQKQCWSMPFLSVGLDGTTSYGEYRLTVIDNNTLDLCLREWADPLHIITKMEMAGTYKRQ